MSGGSPLRVAVAGCGRIARHVHLPLLRDGGEFTLVAVAEADRSRRPELPGVVTVADAGELTSPAFARRHGLDALFVCLPPGAHAGAAQAALEAGLHVYVEKPLAHDMAAAASMLRAARRRPRRVAAVGFNYRHDPALLRLEGWLRDGRLGEPRLVRTLFSTARREFPPWKRRRSSGGGALLDLGSHHLDLLPLLLGRELRSVAAWPAVDGEDAEDTGDTGDTRAHLTLELAGGLRAECDFLFGAGDVDRWEVHCEAGVAVVDRLRGRARWTPADPRGSRLRRALQGAVTWGEDLAALARLREGRRGWGSPLASYRAAFAAFATAVGGEPAPRLARFEDGWHSLARVEAARESMRRAAAGTPARVAPTPLPPASPGADPGSPHREGA